MFPITTKWLGTPQESRRVNPNNIKIKPIQTGNRTLLADYAVTRSESASIVRPRRPQKRIIPAAPWRPNLTVATCRNTAKNNTGARVTSAMPIKNVLFCRKYRRENNNSYLNNNINNITVTGTLCVRPLRTRHGGGARMMRVRRDDGKRQRTINSNAFETAKTCIGVINEYTFCRVKKTKK